MPDNLQGGKHMKKMYRFIVLSLSIMLNLLLVFRVNICTPFLQEGLVGVVSTLGSNIYMMIYVAVLIFLSITAKKITLAVIDIFQSKNWKKIIQLVVSIIIITASYSLLIFPTVGTASIPVLLGALVQFFISCII